MSETLDLVLIRHGEAEHNAHNRAWNHTGVMPPAEFYEIPDSEIPLTPLGLEQGDQVGRWLRDNNLAEADVYIHSPHRRAKQTAGALAISKTWAEEPLLRERDWGAFMSTPHDQRDALMERHGFTNWRTDWQRTMPGGESLQQVFYELAQPFVRKLLVGEYASKRVVAVGHGENIDQLQMVIENQSVGDWMKEILAGRTIPNTAILEYKLKDGVLRRRVTSLSEPEKSWHGGEWMELDFFDEVNLYNPYEHQRVSPASNQ